MTTIIGYVGIAVIWNKPWDEGPSGNFVVVDVCRSDYGLFSWASKGAAIRRLYQQSV